MHLNVHTSFMKPKELGLPGTPTFYARTQISLLESSVNVMTSKKSHVPDDLLSHVFSSVLGESILNTQISKTSNDQCEGIMSEN